MRACASATRPKQEGTWIEEDMIRDYSELHSLGIAHSIEAFLTEKEWGSLRLGDGKSVFWGIHVFHCFDASKVCLAYLVELSQKAGVELIDCQVHTSHLESLGGEELEKNISTSLKSLASHQNPLSIGFFQYVSRLPKSNYNETI